MTNKPTQSLRQQIKNILIESDASFTFEEKDIAFNKMLSLFSQEQKRLSNLIKEEVDKTIPYIETLTKSKNEAYDNGYRDGLKTALNKLESEEL